MSAIEELFCPKLVVNPEFMIEFVAEKFGLTSDDMKRKDRHKSVVHVRHVAYWAARQCAPVPSYPELARLFGGRDHTTILNGVRKVEKELAQSERLATELRCLLLDAEVAWAVLGASPSTPALDSGVANVA